MIHSHISELIGHTPVVRMSGFEQAYGLNAVIAAKLESFNPLGSAKDRIAREMLEQAMEDGSLRPGMCVVEPTSGNTGVGLAYVAKKYGFPVVLTMPDSMSIERRRLLSALGAELVLTPAADGMAGAIREAKRIAARRGGFIPDQFSNPAGPAAHYKTTGPELWQDCGGDIAAFVCAVGTGGTLTGTGRYLRSKIPPSASMRWNRQIPLFSPAARPGRINCRESARALCRMRLTPPFTMRWSLYTRKRRIAPRAPQPVRTVCSPVSPPAPRCTPQQSLHRNLLEKPLPFCCRIRANGISQRNYTRNLYEIKRVV